MPSPLTQLKRAVAVLLPTSILWVFAACVLICGWEHAAAHDESHSAPAAEVTETADTPAYEGCPDAAFLKAAAVARVTLQPEPQAVSGRPASTFTATPPVDAVTHNVPPHGRRFQLDPPLNRLPALRI